jgi:antitoxin component YwqK of YwqJK toxin-antitoxin module
MKRFGVLVLTTLGMSAGAQQSTDTTFYSVGNIKAITYRTGGEIQKVVHYKDNKITSEFQYEKGIPLGASIVYWENGALCVKGDYKNGKKDGLWVRYNDQGVKESERSYKDGVPHGKSIHYYADGAMSSSSFFNAGVIDGQATEFYETGYPSLIRFYKNGDYDGPLTLYYRNGNVKYSGMYKNGKMYGERLCYTENGQLADGGYIAKDDKGLVERQCICIKGRPEGEMKLFRSGVLYMSVNFHDGKPHGPVNYYWNNAAIYRTEYYKDGMFIEKPVNNEQK